MAGLWYPADAHTDFLIDVAGGLFPTGAAFRLPPHGHGRLESALAVAMQPNYPTLPLKAAALQYHLSMNHPFIDGNKRFALAAMEVFLVLNGAFMLTTDEKLVEVSLKVASHEWEKQELALLW